MIKEVEINKIRLNPFQPRNRFKEEALDEMAQSIQTVGLIHPPVVRLVGDNYELVSGERRFRAAKMAGLERISVVVHEGSSQFSAQASLIENIQRVDLNAIEIAKALQRLIDEFGFQHEELSNRIGKKRATVTNYLRLLTLPKSIQESVVEEKISMGHAKAILSLSGFDNQLKLHQAIIEDELSVREAERLSKKMTTGQPVKQPSSRDLFLDQIARRLEERFGTKVSIQGKDKKGVIQIDYYDLDDLDRLLQLVGVEI